MQRLKTPQAWLVFSLALILVGGVLAYLFNTSFGAVDVTRVEFETERGTLAGLLYVPRDASAADPRPAIVTTHGYLNAREMQAAPAIEMSRRGVVVLALDHYSHGNSFLNEVPPGNEFFSFWTHTIYDGVQYLYDQPYVLKDEAGNGAIAVSGHSMGGFSSTMAVAYDEQDYQAAIEAGETAVRKVVAGLSVGADFFWTQFLGITPEAADGLYADRTMGMIAAQFDEFFFDSEASGSGETVVRKDFINTAEGRTFLGNPGDAEVGEFVQTAAGGRRVIYQPFETHPWNHFSLASTSAMIDFYTTAFDDYSGSLVERGGQIWWLKEVTSVLGLVGFYLILIPMVVLLGRLPFLRHAFTEKLPQIQGPTDGKSRAIYWIALAAGSLIPALIYTSYLSRNADNLNIIRVIALIIFFASMGFALYYFLRDRQKEALPYILVGAGTFLLGGIAAGADSIVQTSPVFASPVTNNVVLWASSVASLILIITALVHAVTGGSGMTAKQYGFMVPGRSILASFVIAVIVAIVAFLIVQLVHWLFSVDFRLWLIAIRAFNVPHLLISIVYMPFLFSYFLLNGISLQANTNSSYMNGRKAYLVALAGNIGGLVLWLVLQYGVLLLTGRALIPAQALNGIVLIGLTVNLGIATFVTKKALEKTNNVYTGAFLNTIIIGIVTISTSTLYWSIG